MFQWHHSESKTNVEATFCSNPAFLWKGEDCCQKIFFAHMSNKESRFASRVVECCCIPAVHKAHGSPSERVCRQQRSGYEHVTRTRPSAAESPTSRQSSQIRGQSATLFRSEIFFLPNRHQWLSGHFYFEHKHTYSLTHIFFKLLAASSVSTEPKRFPNVRRREVRTVNQFRSNAS